MILSHRWTKPALLLGALIAIGGMLAAWKNASIDSANAAAASQPEPMEAVKVAVAKQRSHTATTTSVGTVVALRSVTLRNELPGTVRRVNLNPGQIVEAGTVLVALDVSVEQAELSAQKAQAQLAKTLYERAQRMSDQGAASANELDTARAERDVALAQVARTEALIARKTIRAPFRARVGISDVHPGQYLNEGSQLTTLQGVDDSTYVDFSVAQQVAASLRKGLAIEIFASGSTAAIPAVIVATDSRVDPNTRNAVVRARIDDADLAPTPGASVRVRVPSSVAREVISVPVNALRRGPTGDHVFVISEDEQGKSRAHSRNVAVAAVLNDQVLIESGLEAGEQVASSGSFKLRESALVAIASEPVPVASAFH
jgi:membrane fusion protein (multidrug efflux system)